MNAPALRWVLERRGVDVLHVGPDHRDDRVLVVFLHGPAGRTQQEVALRSIEQLAGVRRVEVSEQSWTILRVHVDPECGSRSA